MLFSIYLLIIIFFFKYIIYWLYYLVNFHLYFSFIHLCTHFTDSSVFYCTRRTEFVGECRQ